MDYSFIMPLIVWQVILYPLYSEYSKEVIIINDDGNHLHSLTLKTRYDKDNPKTEIEVIEL